MGGRRSPGSRNRTPNWTFRPEEFDPLVINHNVFAAPERAISPGVDWTTPLMPGGGEVHSLSFEGLELVSKRHSLEWQHCHGQSARSTTICSVLAQKKG